MKKNFLKFSIRLVCIGILLSGVLASAQATVWSKDHLGSAGFDASKPNFVATVDGAVYVTGHFKAAINVGQSISNLGGSDIYLIKYDSSGNVLWSKGFGGAADDLVNAITTDASGNIYLGGTFNSTSIAFGAATLNASATSLFVVKIDSTGTVVWAKGSTNQTQNKDAVKALVVDDAGNVYAGGDYHGGSLKFDTTILTNTSSTSDFFIEKLDASGALQWAKSFGGNLEDNLNGLALSNGNVIAVGSFVSSTVAINNSITLTNTNNPNVKFYSDLFVVAFDSNGVAQWKKTVTGNNLDVAKAVATDTSGNIYVVGNTNSPTLAIGTVNVTNSSAYLMSFLLKLNTTGIASHLTLVDKNTLDAVCVNSNTVYVSGRVNRYGSSYHNLAVAFDSSNLQNKTVYSITDYSENNCNDPDGLYSNSIAVDSNNHLILATFGETKTTIFKLIKKVIFVAPITATVANLPAVGYTYFTVATGGTALAPSTPLSEGQTLYAQFNENVNRNAFVITSGCPVNRTYHKDNDGDGYGHYSIYITSFSATPPVGYVSNSTDCDDTDITKFITYYKYYDADADGYFASESICAGATAPTGYVSVGQTADDCNDANPYVHPGAVEITNKYMDFNGLDNDCNGYIDDAKITTTYITAITNSIYCEKVRNAEKYKFYITNDFTGLSWEIETTEPYFKLSALNGAKYIYQDEFQIAVALKNNNQWLPYGPTAYVYTRSAPTTSINRNQCGTTFTDTNLMISVIPVYLADSYRIQLDTESEMLYYDIPNGGTQFLLNIFPPSISNVYHISVAFKQGNKEFSYGQPCDVKIRYVPTTTIVPSFCGATLATLDTNIAAVMVTGATKARYEITKAGSAPIVYQVASATIKLSQTGVVVAYNTAYSIRVAAYIDGVWGNYGTSCTVTTPALFAPTRLKAKSFEVSAYPNPFETAFNLSIETPSKENVTIAVYDMMGKLVETHQVNPTEVANLQIGINFAAGIYNVIVSQANEMQAIRLIRK